ncbi:MAG: sodium:calcium antiporter [Bdellovibrionales bacterium]|nr:sodium:calcium antiporter [Bdellovibrionales bacterium]
MFEAITVNSFTLILALLFLFLGSHWLVKSLKGISVYFKLKPLFLSLVILGFVSSAPELFVTLGASVKDLPSVALGNILGSNVINILLVFGLSGLLFNSFSWEAQIVRLDMPFLILGVVLLGLLSFVTNLSFLGASFFLILFFIYVILLFKNKKEEKQYSLDAKFRLINSLIFLILGFIGLFLGSSLAVDSSMELVQIFSLDEKFAGVFILSLSTSLPELASALQASFKKEGEIALGSIIGSNIFNTLFVLSIAAFIQPLSFLGLYYDYFFMLGVSVLLFLCLLFFRKIPKFIFLSFICLYFVYIGFTFQA